MKGKIASVGISPERLREAIDYNPSTGEFTWKINASKNIKAGTKVGGKSGYFSIDRKSTTLTRAAFCLMTGVWPKFRVYFRNGDLTDYRFVNLALSDGIEDYSFMSKDERSAFYRLRRQTFGPRRQDKELRRCFGIGLDDYNRILDAQDGKCAICRQPETHMRNGRIKALAIDHCHTTGKVRGLLCSDCNTGLGKMKDDPKILRKAAEYLENQPGNLAPSTGPADTARTTGQNLVQEV